MIWYIITFLVVWAIASVWYFIYRFGDKSGHKKEPWWSWLLFPPALLIAFIVGLYGRWSKR